MSSSNINSIDVDFDDSKGYTTIDKISASKILAKKEKLKELLYSMGFSKKTEHDGILNSRSLLNEDYNITQVYNCIDLLMDFISTLKQNNLICYDYFAAFLILIKLYHIQGYVSLYVNLKSSISKGYIEKDSSTNWKKAQYCFQCANGLSKVLTEELAHLKEGENKLDIVSLMKKSSSIFMYNIAYQEFAYVVFALFRTQNNIIENVRQNDSVITEDAINGVKYSTLVKMLRKITNTYECTKNEYIAKSPDIRAFFEYYLPAMTYLFQGLHSFVTENEIGKSCGFVNLALTTLKSNELIKPLLVPFEDEYESWKEQELEKHPTKKANIFKSKKAVSLISNTKNKIKRVSPSARSSLEKSNNKNLVLSDELLVLALKEFVAPLIYLLKYRFEKYNNFVSFEKIPPVGELTSNLPSTQFCNDISELLKSSKSIEWGFCNSQLTTLATPFDQ